MFENLYNRFRLSEQGKFLWPGFGENMRVIDWICRRIEGEDIAVESPIGLLPKKGSINLKGMTEKVFYELNLPYMYINN